MKRSASLLPTSEPVASDSSKDLGVTARSLPPEERIRSLKELEGVGAHLLGPQTIEEIDARIREFRGDD